MRADDDPNGAPEQLLKDLGKIAGREWLPNRVFEWLMAEEQPLLYITGEPGTGKTAACLWLTTGAVSDAVPLAPAVEQVLTQLRARIDASYFCSSTYVGGASSIDPRDFIRSLYAPLLRRVPKFRSFIQDPGRPLANITIPVQNQWGGHVTGLKIDSYFAAGRSLEDVFAVAIKDPLAGLFASDPNRRLVVLIDGLDEAIAHGYPNIPDLIRLLAPLQKNLKLLLASKHDYELRELLVADFRSIMEIDLSTAPEQAKDIESYVTLNSRMGHVDEFDSRAIMRRAGTNFAIARSLVEAPPETRDPLLREELIAEPIIDYYVNYLRKFLPVVSRRSGASDQLVRSICSYVAVAFHPLPEATLASLCSIQRNDVTRIANYLSSIVVFAGESSGYRFRNPSARAALVSSPPAGDRARAGGIEARYWHKEMLEHYESIPVEELDSYGIRYLPLHMIAASNTNHDDGRVNLENDITAVLELLGSADYEKRVAELGVDRIERAQVLRQVASFLYTEGEPKYLKELLVTCVSMRDPYARGIVMEMARPLSRLAASDLSELIHELLAAEHDQSIWLGLQIAAVTEGTLRDEVYDWILNHGSEGVREAAPYVFYATWGDVPQDRITGFLRALASSTSLLHPVKMQRTMQFVSNLSVTSYVNHGHDLQVMQEVSEVWEYILRRKLHAHWFNRLEVDRLLARTLASHLSRQVVNAALTPELQDVRRFFKQKDQLKWAFDETIPCLDASRPLHTAQRGLVALFQSEFLIARVLAAQVVAIHSYFDRPSDVGIIDEIFETGTGRVRTWILLAHAAPIPDTPGSWVNRLSRYTLSLLSDNRESVDSFDEGSLKRLDVLFLPLGLAVGAHPEGRHHFADLLKDGDDELRIRIVASMGKLGLYQPRLAQQVMKACLDRGTHSAPVARAWGLFYLIHHEECDVFMEEEGLAGLRDSVQAEVDVKEMRFVLDLLGHYNNGINEGVRYPWMREELLKPVFNLLVESSDEKEFFRRYTRQVLRMLRSAEYSMLRWSGPVP